MIENNNLLVNNNQDYVLHFDNFSPVFIDQTITPAVILDLFNNNNNNNREVINFIQEKLFGSVGV